MSKQVKVKFKTMDGVNSVTVTRKQYTHIRQHSNDKIEDNYLSLLHEMCLNGNGTEKDCKRFCELSGINISEFECKEVEKTITGQIRMIDLYIYNYDKYYFYRDVAKAYYSKISKIVNLFPAKISYETSPIFIDRFKDIIMNGGHYYHRMPESIYINDFIDNNNKTCNRKNPLDYDALSTKYYNYPMIHWIDIDINLFCESICEVLNKSYSEIFEEVTV